MDELANLRHDFKDHAEQDETNFLAIHDELKEISRKLDPVIDVYKAVILSKSFITGLASVIIGIGAIGAGIIWFINQAVNK